MRQVSACLATFATLLFAPAAASAANVTLVSSGPTAGGISVDSLPNVDNTITISQIDATHMKAVDTVDTLTTSNPNCTQIDSHTVDCTVTAIAADVLAGGGNDTVTISGAIRSYVVGGTGNDTLQGGSGIDELDGGTGNDTLRGGDGNDFLYDSYSGGLSGDDELDGEGGSDLLYGGKGADTLSDSGATGVDSVTYAFATSGVTLRVADGIANDGTGTDPDALGSGESADNDQVQTGFEKIQGSPFGDAIVGGPAAETINGSGGDDDLDGGPGADTIEGNGGSDTIRARDGVADAHLACDSPSDPSGTVGTADKAFIDADDPEPAGCETVDRLPGATPTPAPGATPVPTNPVGGGPIVDAGLQPLCPTTGASYLRSTSAFGANTRVQVALPVAGWTAVVQLVSTTGSPTLLGPPAARTATGPGTVDIPVSLTNKPAAGTPIRVTVIVAARDCVLPAVTADDVIYQPATGGKARRAVTVPAGTRENPIAYVCSDPAIRNPMTKEEETAFQNAITDGRIVCNSPPQKDPEPKCEEYAPIFSSISMTGTCIKKDPKTGVLESKATVKINGLQVSFGTGGSITFNPKTNRLELKGKHKLEIPLRANGRSQGSIVLRDSSSGFGVTFKTSTIDVSTDGGKELGGFLLETSASAKLEFNKTGGKLTLDLKLPKKFAGLRAHTEVVWDDGGIKLEAVKIELPALQVGKLSLSKGELSYQDKDGKVTWYGQLTLQVPGPKTLKAFAAPDVEVKAKFVNGGLTEGSVDVRGINKPFGHPAVWLQRLKVTLAISEQEVTFGGEVDLTFGPRIKDVQVGELKTTASYTFAEPGVWRGTGEFSLLTKQEGSGSFSYTTDGKLDFEGRLQLPFRIMNIDGRVKGTVALPNTFNVNGQVDLEFIGRTIQADLNANEKAITVCGSFKGLSLGATIPYETKTPEFLTGCGLAPWGKPDPKGDKKARRLATTAATTSLPGGLPQAAFSAKGSGGVPNVALVGPGGKRLQVGVDRPDGIAFADPDGSKVYFLVAKPEAGDWSLEVQDGSVPVIETEVAEGLKASKVKAKVKTDGSKRILEYDIDGPKGQRVKFFERAIGIERLIKTASGSGKGTATFTPTDGVSGKRDIVAFVEQDGLAQGKGEKVATFRAGPTLKPGQVGCIAANNSFTRVSSITIGGEGTGDCLRLKVTRGGSGDQVTVTWGKAPEAEYYRVSLKSSGRKDTQTLGEGARKYVFTDIDRDDGVKVEIAALNENGVAGPTIRAELDAAKIKSDLKKPLADDGVLGLVEVG